MKKLALITVILLLNFSVFAAHLYGGYMYANLLSGRTVQYTAILYSNPAAAGSSFLSEIEIKLGDGSSKKVQRSEVQQNGNIQSNVYTVTHTYPSDGNYLAAIDEPSLVSDVRNLNFGIRTDNINFRVEFLMKISSSVKNKGFLGKQLASLVPEAIENQKMQYNAVVSNQDINVISAFKMHSYFDDSIPFNTEGFSINQYSGMIQFTPQVSGIYVIPVVVEMRNENEVIAKMHYLQPIRVLVGVPNQQQLYSASEAEWVNAGWYRKVVTTNTPVNYTFSAIKNVNTLGYTLNAFGVLPDTNATFGSRSTNDSLFTDLSWTPQFNQQRKLPYFVTYRIAPTQNPARIMDVQLAFYHGAPLTASVDEMTGDNNSLKVYPNPCNRLSFATIPLTGFAKITVTDVSGKVLLTDESKGDYKLDLTPFKANILFIQCEDKEGKISHAKLLID